MEDAAAPVPAEVASVLAALARPGTALLLGANGTAVWRSPGWPAADARAAMAAAANGGADTAASPSTSTIALPGGRTLYRAPVASDGGPAAGTLLVAADGAPNSALAAAVHALAALVATIERLNGELDAMAVELADRYEELNLVYATSRDSARAPEGRVGLENLVKQCREHLGVSLCALVLPPQHLTIESHAPQQPLADLAEFLRAVGLSFFEHIARQRRPIVCNESLDDAAPLARFGPLKLAAAPVGNGGDAICGVLVMVNPAGAPDFSNSDKNLLASIAEKAAKLVERSYDSLTGLLSRFELERRLEALLPHCRDEGAEHAVLCIDVDELGIHNETLGPEVGDAVLRCVARHLAALERPGRLVARLDSDDFALLLERCPLPAAAAFAEDLCASIRKLKLRANGQALAITVSIGVAPLDADSESAAAVLRAAELASAAAHDNGRDRVHVYQDNADTIVQRNEQMRWVGRIHNALRSDRFRLFGQRIQTIAGRDDPHVEVLLRLLDDDGAVHSPSSFLPAAEQYHLMPSVDRWVITRTLALLKAQPAGRLPVCSVNLSGQSMSDESFLEFILTELERSTVRCDRLCFEITETAAIKSLDTAKLFMLRLKQRGCQFSLDDFGTGLSSFSYLKALPFDFVKIDGSFVRGILEDRVSESMVRAITEVGHAMGLGIIAEYVENAAIKAKLASIGVDFAQGYAIEPPIPLAEHFSRPPLGAAVNA
jgi:diguanylate cyclase (GGDEF)-like protein